MHFGAVWNGSALSVAPHTAHHSVIAEIRVVAKRFVHTEYCANISCGHIHTLSVCGFERVGELQKPNHCNVDFAS